ncbi:endonuclease/exonuclease/phosphatase family protein [Embleya sp. NPDC056575]|uniref:endonuclease/exonuclease/phosphatase family protein n=1 Tax=unclassified Embleya TaxID=2699296 RepID=UPI003696EC30
MCWAWAWSWATPPGEYAPRCGGRRPGAWSASSHRPSCTTPATTSRSASWPAAGCCSWVWWRSWSSRARRRSATCARPRRPSPKPRPPRPAPKPEAKPEPTPEPVGAPSLTPPAPTARDPTSRSAPAPAPVARRTAPAATPAPAPAPSPPPSPPPAAPPATRAHPPHPGRPPARRTAPHPRNGGHDVPTLLARRLDLPYRFAPAADPQWGDAVLTRKPIRHLESIVLPAGGAPTGAQALGVVVEAAPGKRLGFVATHLQDADDEVPQRQADRAAAFATGLAEREAVPVTVLGDLNAAVDSPQVPAFTARGPVDGLARVRPVRTYPADRPRREIDQVLVDPRPRVLAVEAPPSKASDHLPVAVTPGY